MTTEATGTSTPLPPVVDQATWRHALDELPREKAVTRELDAIAAQRRRLPAVVMPDYTLEGPAGPVPLVDVFDGRRQLVVYNHMWFAGETWQCGGCTSFTSQFVRLDFLEPYDARFVIVTQGPIDEALAYKRRVGNRMDWYSTANSSFGSDVGAPPGGGFAQRVRARRRRHRLPDLAHRRQGHRAALPCVSAPRPPAVRPPGGMAGSPRGLAPGPHLRRVARVRADRRALRRRSDDDSRRACSMRHES